MGAHGVRHTSKAARQAIKGAVIVTRNGVKAGYIVSRHAVVASSRAAMAVARRAARVTGRVTRAGISKTRRLVVGAAVQSKNFATQVALPAAARAARNTAALVLRVTSSSAYAVARSLFSACSFFFPLSSFLLCTGNSGGAVGADADEGVCRRGCVGAGA